MFQRPALTGCVQGSLRRSLQTVGVFFSLDSRVFFFLGVAFLDYNFGVSPGVAENERDKPEHFSNADIFFLTFRSALLDPRTLFTLDFSSDTRPVYYSRR